MNNKLQNYTQKNISSLSFTEKNLKNQSEFFRFWAGPDFPDIKMKWIRNTKI